MKGRRLRGALVAAFGLSIAVLAYSAQTDGPSGPATSGARSATTDASTIAGGRSTGPKRSDQRVRALPDSPSTLTSAEVRGIAFTDVSAASGLTVPHSDRNLTTQNGMTSGVAVADVDGDGDLDLYLTRVGRANGLLLNDGAGHFSEVADSVGATGADPREGSGAAAFGDIDGDDDLDLYVTGAGAAPNVLYRNDGGRFVDVTSTAGVVLPEVDAEAGNQSHGITFADFDHDGDLDLLTLHWDATVLNKAVFESGGDDVATGTCARTAPLRGGRPPSEPGTAANRSRLFRNDGSGLFADVTASVGLHLDATMAFTGQFIDIDGDGWEDLLIAGDACTSRLYRNVGGTRFDDITAASGVGTDENAMGSVVRDLDSDARPDWFLTSISFPTSDRSCPAQGLITGCSGNRAYLNRGGARFDDATSKLGLRHGWWGWGAAIEDFGNDGRLEVVMTNGFNEPPEETLNANDAAFYEPFLDDPMRFWVRGDSGFEDAAFEDAASLVGLDGGEDRRNSNGHLGGLGHGLVAFDADGDGDLDLIVAETGAVPRMYRNDTPRSRGWLTIRLDDPSRPGNRQGLGARIAVATTETDRPTVGWIDTGGSYESQRPPEFHVGLGTAHRVARIEVTWPGASAPQVMTDVAADRVVTITRDS